MPFSGCAAAEPQAIAGTAPNDILTFTPNAANKPIVHIGMQYYAPVDDLQHALEKAFPDYLFVFDYSAAAGTDAESVLLNSLRKNTFDLLISGGIGFLEDNRDYVFDLSAQRFLNQYLLNSLNNASLDGRVYALPGPSALAGIAYNTEMFAAHGWQAPQTTEEFFTLCETIRAAGITPFSTCFKYAVQVNRVLGMMCYDELYLRPEDAKWLADLQAGQAAYKGHMEPFYALAKRFADTGIISPDSFTASLTKQRQAFWAGEVAMIDYPSSIYDYARSENAPFEIGMMPYPTKGRENSGFTIIPEYYFSIPASAAKDPDNLALMLDVMAFLSTPAGQAAMLGDSLKISNVVGVDIPADNPATKYVQEAYQRGNLYPVIEFDFTKADVLELQKASVQAVFEGAQVDEAIAMMDESLRQSFAAPTPKKTYETLAVAEADFTMLESSYYLADKLRQAAGADVGLMIDRGYFRSNLASFDQGEITADLSRFVMKGVSAEDYLTSYRLTGAQLKALLEHPIVNGEEIDALIAASGLAITYAPWEARGSRVVKLTLENGGDVEDGQLYTVAAYQGVIDEAYYTDILHVHDDLGTLPDILEAALRRDGKIKPDIAGRVTLLWPQAE